MPPKSKSSYKLLALVSRNFEQESYKSAIHFIQSTPITGVSISLSTNPDLTRRRRRRIGSAGIADETEARSWAASEEVGVGGGESEVGVGGGEEWWW
jgi:hypothetical protein